MSTTKNLNIHAAVISARELEQLALRRFACLKKKAKRIKPAFGKPEIHEFRVGYKQLRAFLRVIFGGEPGNPFNKSLRKLYRAAGRVRDLQLFLNKATANNAPKQPALKAAQANRALAKAREKLSHRLGKSLAKHTDWTVPALLPPGFSNMNARAFAAREWSAVASALALADDDEQLHTIRKKLKDLYYANEAFKGYVSISPGLILRMHEPGALKKCTDALGDWQDLITSYRVGSRFGGGKHSARLPETAAIRIAEAKRKALTLVRDILFTGAAI